jgi:hypothetical protein
MSEAPRVVSLRGEPIAQPGVPQADVIEQLERALEMARGGEIAGVILIANHANECVSSSRRGYSDRRTVGELEIAKANLVDALRGDAGP